MSLVPQRMLHQSSAMLRAMVFERDQLKLNPNQEQPKDKTDQLIDHAKALIDTAKTFACQL